MFRILKAAIAGVMLTASAAWAQANEANEAIETVIGNQLQAFNDRDVTEAFSYASPTIKGIFRDPRNFGAMVENGFPMVWDNADVRFLSLREEQGVLVQRVQLRAADGAIHLLDYAMIETDDGWQINGVQIIEADLAA